MVQGVLDELTKELDDVESVEEVDQIDEVVAG